MKNQKGTTIKLNMASSIDGKITTLKREKFTFGSNDDRFLMERLRTDADCVIIGANTVKIEDTPLIIRNPKLLKRRIYLKKNLQPVNIVISSKLDFNFSKSHFFSSVNTKKIIFTTNNINRQLKQKASKYAEIIETKSTNKRVNLVEVINYLKNKLNYRNILIEGGGELNFSMLYHNLIDEIYITLCPYVFGGKNIPTTIMGYGFDKYNIKRFKLISCEKNGVGELFLHYKIYNKKIKIATNKFNRIGSQILY